MEYQALPSTKSKGEMQNPHAIFATGKKSHHLLPDIDEHQRSYLLIIDRWANQKEVF
jgi:hypothetical protein